MRTISWTVASWYQFAKICSHSKRKREKVDRPGACAEGLCTVRCVGLTLTKTKNMKDQNEIRCPACGSYEYDTQECAECGYSVYKEYDESNGVWTNWEEVNGRTYTKEEWDTVKEGTVYHNVSYENYLKGDYSEAEDYYETGSQSYPIDEFTATLLDDDLEEHRKRWRDEEPEYYRVQDEEEDEEHREHREFNEHNGIDLDFDTWKLGVEMLKAVKK